MQTINRNSILTIDHNFDANWGFTTTVPLINRDHEHIHNHRGARLLETWDFTQPGESAFSAATRCRATIRQMFT